MRRLVALLFATILFAPVADSKTKRSHRARAAFMRANPCPGGEDKGSVKRCRGWIVDHVCALKCGGKDEPANMAWQTLKEAKRKDAWELSCISCKE